MARTTLRKVKPIRADMIPPAGSVPAGITPDHRQIYSLTRARSKSVPKVDPKTGERIWRKHPLTGEPLLPVRRAELYSETILFTLEDEKNGNVRQIPYIPETPEELAVAKRKNDIAIARDQLAEALLDSGMTPAEFIAKLGGKRPVAPAPAPEAPKATPIDDTEYPVMVSPGRWKLSNGAVMQGKKADAVEAEEAVQEAKAAAAQTPEE